MEETPATKTFGKSASSVKAVEPKEQSAVTKNESILEGFAREFELQAKKVIFNVTLETGDLMIQVVNRETGDVVRQIPPEEVIEFARRFREVLGLLIDEKI